MPHKRGQGGGDGRGVGDRQGEGAGYAQRVVGAKLQGQGSVFDHRGAAGGTGSPNGYYVCSYSRRLHYSVSVYEVQGVPMATTCAVTAGGYTTRCPCMRYRESQWLLRV